MKKIITVGILFFVAIFALGVGVGNYFYELALNPLVDKSSIFEADHNQSESMADESEWFETLGYETVQLESDGLRLHSYVLQNDPTSHRYAIISHGYTSEAANMTAYARRFFEEGYHVILPDARGHGNSEGGYIGMGWHERSDILLWIDEVLSVDEEAEILLFGVSMGAATVMSVSGEKLPEQVKVIIEDCGYTSVHDIFAYQLKALYGLPAFPVLNFASLVSSYKAGYTLSEASMITQVAKSETPMLFIHGEEDAFVPYEMVYELYEAADVEKELFIVSGAGHAEAALIAGETYWETVFGFIDKVLE